MNRPRSSHRTQLADFIDDCRIQPTAYLGRRALVSSWQWGLDVFRQRWRCSWAWRDERWTRGFRVRLNDAVGGPIFDKQVMAYLADSATESTRRVTVFRAAHARDTSAEPVSQHVAMGKLLQRRPPNELLTARSRFTAGWASPAVSWSSGSIEKFER